MHVKPSNSPLPAALRNVSLVYALLATCLSGCLREPLESRRSAREAHQPRPSGQPQPTAADGVILAGTFQEVAKKVSGTVTLERTGDAYELVLHNVALSDSGPVHVYFVGLPAVLSSADLDGVDAKYDFGPLEETGAGGYVAQHRVKLPSQPKPELRSVALINPRFGVVLASSSLKEPR